MKNKSSIISLKVFKKLSQGYNCVEETGDTSNSFNIGSITKIFTAITICRLEELEMLSLTSNISHYFDEFKYSDASIIRIKDLLTHTSGLGKDFSNSNLTSGDFLKRIVKTFSLKKYNNEVVEYQNSNYYILGLLAERVTKKKLFNLYLEFIIKPLDLKNTIRIPREVDDTRFTEYTLGAGDLQSTIDDLSKLMISLIDNDGKVLNPRTFTDMTSYKKEYHQLSGEGFSLGWAFRLDNYFGHNGIFGDSYSSLWFHPKLKSFVISYSKDYPSIENDTFKVFSKHLENEKEQIIKNRESLIEGLLNGIFKNQRITESIVSPSLIKKMSLNDLNRQLEELRKSSGDLVESTICPTSQETIEIYCLCEKKNFHIYITLEDKIKTLIVRFDENTR